MAEILVVDDEVASARFLSETLGREGHDVRIAADGVEALLSIEERLPQLVLADLRMPIMGGLELLDRIKQRWPELPVLLCSVEGEAQTIVQAVQRGAVNYLVKPCPPQRIRDAVARALKRPASPERHSAREIVGKSAAMLDVRHAVALASRSEVNVLVTGETGTGKELVVRAIHKLSGRGPGPLIVHNCASAPFELFESMFFGHQRGAFTGADSARKGLLEAADGGVLFLDELEAMPLDQQAKLLRVMDDGEFRPLGATSMRHASVRFIAATNRDPLEMIRHGDLRQDLYYRLRGFTIHVPPLRDRREDIPLLAAHFLGAERAIAPDAMDALRRSDWPGNVRELKNSLLSCSALAESAPMHVEDLRLQFDEPELPVRPAEGALSSLEEAERRHIGRVLRACEGNRSRAARVLGIDRTTLRRKLAQMSPSEGDADLR